MQMTVTYQKNIIFLIFKFYNMKIIKFASSQNNKNTKTNNYSLNLWYKIKIYVPKSRIITADVDVSSSKQNLPNKKVKTVYFKIWTCANASEFRGHLCNFLYVLPKPVISSNFVRILFFEKHIPRYLFVYQWYL